ncbi:MAG: hypothetical protein ACOZIN_02955 [Myxococcota bacterium]
MTLRIAAFVGALSFLFTACPPENNSSDGGDDGNGIVVGQGECTGGCGELQICDTQRRICVDGCGGCDGGVCTKNAAGQFQCVAQVTACNGATCSQGQAACVAGSCSCLPFSRASSDTCFSEGQQCSGYYNPVTLTGGTCTSPKTYQSCKTEGCPSGNCASCPAGNICEGVFTGLENLCLRTCQSNAECHSGEMCAGLTDTTAGCLPSGVFSQGDCWDYGALPDGGRELVSRPVGNRCLLGTISQSNGASVFTPQETTPSANCQYEFFRFSNQLLAVATCRPAGTAAEGQPCRRDYAPGTTALQCGTGLECAQINGEDGVCMRMCNATPPRGGIRPQPACGADEACVNIFRQESPNSVAGVCMKSCDVFSATRGTCAAVGTTPASCVPTDPLGFVPVSTDGSGICVPQRAGSVAGVGQPCAETDSLKGATCASGLLCLGANNSAPVCEQPCDLSCKGATPPGRCATQPNAHCPTGKTCSQITVGTGVTLGVCR